MSGNTTAERPRAWTDAAECACIYCLTDGFCRPQNDHRCKCWAATEQMQVDTGLSMRAIGWIFRNLQHIEKEATP